MLRSREAVYWLVFAGLLLAAISYGQLVDRFDTNHWLRIALFAAMGVIGLLLVFLAPALSSARSRLLYLALPALLLRLAVFPSAPSDDSNRYLWEGRLITEGISPYTTTADDDRLAPLRDVYWEGMNHKDKRTVYPPLVQLLFALIAQIAYAPEFLKLVILFADCSILAGIVAILVQRGQSAAWAGFYAFSPLSLIAYAGEAHFDALFLAPAIWAVWAWDRQQQRRALFLICLATGIKWITLPLIPFFCRPKRVIYGFMALIFLLLPALYFWDSLPQLLRGLFEFGHQMRFNAPFHALLHAIGIPPAAASAMTLIIFAGVIGWRWFAHASDPIDRHFRWILGTLLLVAPTLHFWYLTWLLPFVCLRPSLAWLSFSVSAAAYFFVWTQEPWGLSPLQQSLFWGPFFAAASYELWSTRGRVLWPLKIPNSEQPPQIAVVIPTYQAADCLGECLASLEQQSHPAAAVHIMDAGSSDATAQIAQQSKLKPQFIRCHSRGRGQQIAAGIAAAQAPWVLVLHADATLQPHAIDCLQRYLRAHPQTIGGALGQRFIGQPIELLPIEILNDLRLLFTRTAFGDQAQFFHRTTALGYQLMPEQPLMEDIEASWRIRELGEYAQLNQPCQVCHRRWQADRWLPRFRLVMRLVARYRWVRFRQASQTRALSEQLYRDYYSQ
jgi:hypothetical protein